jgi:hypothetical protein
MMNTQAASKKDAAGQIKNKLGKHFEEKHMGEQPPSAKDIEAKVEEKIGAKA